MHLIPYVKQIVAIESLCLSIEIQPNESIWTESSYKFTRESTVTMLETAGFKSLNEHDSFNNIKSAWETNALGTQSLLSVASEKLIKKFIVKRMNEVGYNINDDRICSESLVSKDGREHKVSKIEIDLKNTTEHS